MTWHPQLHWYSHYLSRAGNHTTYVVGGEKLMKVVDIFGYSVDYSAYSTKPRLLISLRSSKGCMLRLSFPWQPAIVNVCQRHPVLGITMGEKSGPPWSSTRLSTGAGMGRRGGVRGLLTPNIPPVYCVAFVESSS